jgi:uncharacterized protein (DUF1697 family)
MTGAERYVALLRGINVGRAKRIAMADLRDLVGSLGFSDVRTLLNSGNVLFTGRRVRPERLAGTIEDALVERLGVASRVTVLDGAGLAEVVDGNPLREGISAPSRFLVAFLRDPASARTKLEPLDRREWGGDAFALGTRAAYLWCPGGILQSPLLDVVSRSLGDGVTTRNWATVTRLQAML